MEKWFVASKRADFNKIGEVFHISPVTARLMRNRDLTTIEEMQRYLYGSLSDHYDPHLLKDADKGAEIIKEKIEAGKKIRIISDYDVDGVSSNYILYQGLKRCGADVDYKIPDRVEDGYGINEHLIEQAAEDGIDTIITCDNGIAASAQIAYGNSLGLTIVVTDHHDIPFQKENDEITYLLPPAAAVINPKQKDCSYPFKSICGAVVVYKFIQVLYDLFQIDQKESEAFLEIAAMATVCDVMPLFDENRILVKEGLRRIRQTEIVGLQALIEANHLEDKKLSSYHFGFILGPCINASGRLTSAKEALELLLCKDKEICRQKAEALTALNAERKEMTADGVKAAKAYLESTGHAKDKVLVVYLPDCHESIAGMYCLSRMKEYYHKPVFFFFLTKEGLKGSGRSIEAYHMYQEMNKIKECFDKFGGHPMAAGLSMQEDRLEEFRGKLNTNTTLTEEDFVEKVHIDVALPISYLSESLIKEFELLEPFGNENTKPLFAQKDLYIKGIRVLGTTGRCLKLFLSDGSQTNIEAMYFGESDGFLEELSCFCGKEEAQRVQRGLPHHIWMDVTYYPQINEWRGQKNIQIVIQNYRFKHQ